MLDKEEEGMTKENQEEKGNIERGEGREEIKGEYSGDTKLENDLDDELEDEEQETDQAADFDDEDEEEKSPFMSALWDVGKDVIIAFLIVILIIGSIYIYTGNWPPVVVVESDSMQHGELSYLSVIDTGDLVLVKEIDGEDDVKSYMEGMRKNHKTYGEYGDVLIYRKNGYTDITPVIHRALIWVEYNETGDSFDIPELKHHDAGPTEDWYVVGGEQRWYDLSGTIVLKNIGYDHQDVSISLANILNNFDSQGVEPHSGWITLGDHNRGNYDQAMLPDEHGGRVRPIKPEWVVGKARGELPWFGLIKLYFQDDTITERAPENSWTMLWVTLILIFAIPISIDIVLILYERRKEKKEGEKETDQSKEWEEKGKQKEKEPKEEKEPPPPDDEEELPPPDDEEDEKQLGEEEPRDEVEEKETEDREKAVVEMEGEEIEEPEAE